MRSYEKQYEKTNNVKKKCDLDMVSEYANYFIHVKQFNGLSFILLETNIILHHHHVSVSFFPY
jgi:hypothetical protein